MGQQYVKIIFIGLCVSLFSCAHYPSGQYVQISKGESFNSLSKRYGVPVWKIKDANSNQNITVGSWIYVPLERGISAYFPRAKKADFISATYRSKTKNLLWPVPTQKKVSSKFGKRWGRKHEGIDIPARMGAAIVAVDDGVVVYSGNGVGGYGNLTVVSHNNGIYSVYAHAKKNMTRKWQRVSRGEVIAKVGKTGRATGPHLHFELRDAGRAVDPLYVYKMR